MNKRVNRPFFSIMRSRFNHPIRWTKIAAGVIFLSQIFLALLPKAVLADDTTQKFQVIGSASVVKGDLSAARNAAISKSLRGALDAAVMAVLPREALIRQFKLVGESLSGQADRFIREYKVLTEAMTGDEYRVYLEAVIWMDQVRKHLFDAGIADVRVKVLTVLLLIAEPSGLGAEPVYGWSESQSAPLSPAESGIQGVLSENAYSVVRPSLETSGVLEMLSIQSGELSDTDGLEIAKRMQADMVVLGKGVFAPGTESPGTSGYSIEGTVTARTLRVDTGETVADIIRSFTAADPDGARARQDALSGAGRLAGTDLSDQIARNFIQKGREILSVSLLVRGTRNLGNFVSFRRSLAGIPDVKQMHIEEIRADESLIKVVFQGTIEALADSIARIRFETFEVLLLETTPERILLTLSHREPDVGNPPEGTQ